MKQKGISLIAVIVFLFTTSHTQVPHRMFGIKTVVIDAGHGGHDVGCIGSSSKEKSIALDVALKLGEMIENKFPDVRVVYTRKKDEFIELHERAGIANRTKADLFICIHCNSGASSAYGPETYVMGLHKSADNLSVARRENSSILLEKDYKTKYDGFDPNSPEANIIFTLFQNAFMNQSIAFASKIQSEFEEYAGRNNRGVKQAGFLVLYKTAMPSVLVETGFLTNKSEEKYLLSEKGQTDIAASIFKAFKEYKIDMEGEGSHEIAAKDSPVQAAAPAENHTSEPVKKDSVTEAEKKYDKPKDTAKENKEAPVVAENNSSSKKDSAATSATVPVKPVPKTETEEKNLPGKKSADVAPEIFYTVQIGAVPAGTATGLERYKEVNDVKKIPGEDGMWRFTTGSFQNINEAINFQTVMRGKGFKDAFVTAYHNNKRITLQEAAKLLSKGTSSDKKN